MSLLRDRKIELIQRTLAIRHKLKVHESLEQPKTHEELSLFLMSKWELEDELHAIEQILNEDREGTVKANRKLIEEGVLGKKKVRKR